MTALREALQSAGYIAAKDRLAAVALEVVRLTPEQLEAFSGYAFDQERDRIQRRILQVAREAVQASPKNWDGAKEAFYAKVRKDPDLLWELLAPYRAQASQFWLTQASAQLHEEKKRDRPAEATRVAGVGAVHLRGDNQKASDRPRPQTQSAEGQVAVGDHESHAPRALAAAGAAAVSAVARLSLLDTFKVNGQAIGDLTAAEANKWAGSRERDARFVRLLTANLPPDQPIRKYRTPDDTQALYAQAEAERAE